VCSNNGRVVDKKERKGIKMGTIFQDMSTSALSTVLAAVIMMSQHCKAISAVAFRCVIAVITPLAFVLAFIILM
jgi:hypothetical protein